MDSPQTLHDFVLNLLRDQDARAAFQLDPQGALHAAGLADVDAADVRDVVPLVVDYAPVSSLPALDGAVGQLASAVPGGGVTGAIQQLRILTSQLPSISQMPGQLSSGQVPNLDVSMAATGTVVGTVNGLAGLSGSLSSGGGALSGVAGLSGDFSHLGDVTHTLDSGAVSDATNTVTSTVTGTVSQTVGGTVDTTVGHLPGTLADPTDLSHPIGAVTGLVDNTATGVTGGLTHLLGGGMLDLSGSGTATPDATTLHGSATSPAGTASADAGTHTGGLLHGAVGGLLQGGTDLLGGDDHLLDVSHLF